MLGLFSLEKRSLGAIFQYLKGIYGEDGSTVVLRLHGDRTKGYRQELLQGKFRLDASKKKRKKKIYIVGKMEDTGIGCPEKWWSVGVHGLACQGPWITPETLLSTEGLAR